MLNVTFLSEYFLQNKKLSDSIAIIQSKNKLTSCIQNQRSEVEALDILDTKPSDSSFLNTENTLHEENSHQFDSFFNSSEDSEIDEQPPKASSIRKINKILKSEFKEKLSSFREAFDHVLCSSAIDSARISVLNSELDSIRKTMFEAIDSSHSNHHSLERKSCLNLTPNHWKQSFMLENVLKQIEELQEEIKMVSINIVENEKEISQKNQENLELKSKLEVLEAEFFKYLTNDVNTERASCTCRAF